MGRRIRSPASEGAGAARHALRSLSDLESRFDAASDSLGPGGGLWISWPKKSSRVESDLGQAEVRRQAMDRGLVDFKIAAIDQTWSGLRFARKKR